MPCDTTTDRRVATAPAPQTWWKLRKTSRRCRSDPQLPNSIRGMYMWHNGRQMDGQNAPCTPGCARTQFQFPIDRSATEQATPTTLNYDCPETACICTAAAAAGALCNVTASLALSVNSTRHYHHCICPSSRPASFALCSRACVAAGANRECF